MDLTNVFDAAKNMEVKSNEKRNRILVFSQNQELFEVKRID